MNVGGNINIMDLKVYNKLTSAFSCAGQVFLTPFILANWASLVAQLVKNLPAMRETRVRSLGWEDLLEKEMATHPSLLAWKIPRTDEAGGLQSMGSQRVRHN